MLQAKLKVNRPGDVYEQEADQVAEQVMRMPETRDPERVLDVTNLISSSLQRKCAACASSGETCAECGEEESAQRKTVQGVEGEEIEPDESGMPKRQAGASGVSGATSLRVPRDSGQPLEPMVRGFMESAMERDFGQVRVHIGPAAEESARQLRARAYTVGNDIYFNHGEYRPGDRDSRKLLAHELTHVVQQAGGAPGISSIQRQLQRQNGNCPQGKQPRVVRNDCSTGGPENESNFIRHLEVSVSGQTVVATWGPQDASQPSTGTDTWDCSPRPGANGTPLGPDVVGKKCGVNHTNRGRDGMAWFTGFQRKNLQYGFHDSQPVGPGIHSHGCVRVLCSVARTINRNSWSGVTTINVTA